MKPRFRVRSLHQIEITSRCNLRCRYCPSPHLPRAKMDMSDDVYLSAMDWVRHFAARGTQREVNLAGIGESTMHPSFIRYVALARDAIGERGDVTMATNGLLVTDEMAVAIKPFRPRIWVSMHRPEKAGPAIEILKRHGLLAGYSADPSLAAIDWAGQVEWHVSAQPHMACDWIVNGRAFLMADGRVSACCLDATGAGVFAELPHNALEQEYTSPYSLCKGCHLDVNVTGYDQRGGEKVASPLIPITDKPVGPPLRKVGVMG